MIADVGSLANARELRKWLKKDQRQQGLTTSPDFAPSAYDCEHADNLGEADPERMDPKDRWLPYMKAKLKDYRDKKLIYKLGDPSPTHLDERPYKGAVAKKEIV